MQPRTQKVEQITKNASIVSDYDQVLSRKDIGTVLGKFFESVMLTRSHYEVEWENNKYVLLVKNITHLGCPWPGFKKRIQVPASWNDHVYNPNSLLIGLYTYKDEHIFAFFDKKERGKNSAAHISSIDLLKGVEYGIFQKVDKGGNHIIVCSTSHFLSVFQKIVSHKAVTNHEEISLFDDFFVTLPRHWNGISTYKEMIAANFTHKFQSEWPGWYLEFKFNDFLKKDRNRTKVCKYVQNKKQDQNDLDLIFPKSQFLGDLKTHAHDSEAILGNDKKTCENAIDEHGKLWYISFYLSYRKDKDFDCTVSKFWNREINKAKGKGTKKLRSYCGKMKYDGNLVGMSILEINKFNFRYISDFKQGKQSNGALRNIKIRINKKNIDNFVIHRQ